MITAGALSAVYGIVQYGIFDFDNLGQRVQGTLGHYMTYSGLIMLVACVAAARVMFREQDRLWAALIMPAVLVALALTFSRNAWVGACAGISLLFLLRDFRLVALLPVAAALFLAFAPAPIADRLYSTFRLSDPTNMDRLAMIRSGLRIIKDDPLTGVGPDMIIQVYPHYRDPGAVKQSNPHLHNVPLQIAAERGLPGARRLALVHRRRCCATSAEAPIVGDAFAADCGAGGVVAMLAAGMFEYNFGDSEFLMLFLLLVTLPYAADRAPAARRRSAIAASRLTMPALDALLDRIAGRSVLVVGDLMLDHFVYGRVDRISPEAPVPVVQFEREEYRLGGAANVAQQHRGARRPRRSRRASSAHDAEAARLLAELRRASASARGGIVADRRRGARRESCAS